MFGTTGWPPELSVPYGFRGLLSEWALARRLELDNGWGNQYPSPMQDDLLVCLSCGSVATREKSGDHIGWHQSRGEAIRGY